MLYFPCPDLLDACYYKIWIVQQPELQIMTKSNGMTLLFNRTLNIMAIFCQFYQSWWPCTHHLFMQVPKSTFVQRTFRECIHKSFHGRHPYSVKISASSNSSVSSGSLQINTPWALRCCHWVQDWSPISYLNYKEAYGSLCALPSFSCTRAK
jgi:hypothetical protein